MIRCDPEEGGDAIRVTFALAADGLDGDVSVVGDFNDWDPTATPLAAQGGTREATVVLAGGRRYAFRYLGADGTWFNDPGADDYEDNDYGGADGVVDLTRVAAPQA